MSSEQLAPSFEQLMKPLDARYSHGLEAKFGSSLRRDWNEEFQRIYEKKLMSYEEMCTRMENLVALNNVRLPSVRVGLCRTSALIVPLTASLCRSNVLVSHARRSVCVR